MLFLKEFEIQLIKKDATLRMIFTYAYDNMIQVHYFKINFISLTEIRFMLLKQ